MANCGTERRKTLRYPVSDGSLFVCSHGSDNLLAVKNISTNGLQFVYFPDTCDTPECQLADIIEHSDVYFCVAGVCCRIIYDIPSLSEDLSFSGIRTRIAGVEFSQVTNDQHQKLSSILADL